ncbi:MAG: acetyl-CoA C-acetyltransferase [Desulfarculaceae bacterium]|nr:acetyl-CoA C-acetyltransferase [Desulfarculaceae bacterium]MCF8073145.1 acetyl-CoA C-acetyltransferase [Desulfarculaceae bacterium]MCF8101770.1 acetyl-CoA C-acetyltransferase [Desulfarculaceae bacterium]MCF8118392.1 acetyl-CoA C-acetyltransferase [Desulfarculaceae bacterium]
MREVVIAGYLRSAQSKCKPDDWSKDWLGNLRADDLVGKVVNELVKRTDIDPNEIDDFIVGSSIGVGENYTWGGRFPLFLAGLPETVPAKFVDQQCGSSMASVHVGALEIMAGLADIVVACGMEHLSRVPMGQARRKGGMVSINPELKEDPKYDHLDMPTALNMGLTAEKLAELKGIGRQEMDQWGKRSHDLTIKARKEGYFETEILPIETQDADGNTMVVDRDQAAREGVEVEKLGQLRPAFKEGGLVTAGNASPLNAGASALILADKQTAIDKGLTIMATVRAMGFAGVDPSLMGIGPVPATQKALKQVGLTPQDIDYWEINEAFTVVVLNCINELGIDPARVNIKGGGTAIGHPLGATGCRLIGTLARILEEKGGRWGCANACVGGGQGVATIIEREG